MSGPIPRYENQPTHLIGDRAVVVGGSMTGLLTARVLSDLFAEVIVLERDSLPSKPVARDGVPQSTQPHLLMRPILVLLEDLFPGYSEELLANGGLVVDWSTDFRVYAYGDYLSYGEYDPVYCASRPLVEHCTRRRVRQRAAITIREGTSMIDYRFGGGGERVVGVTHRNEQGNKDTLHADLVVDATGRTSRTPALLEARGYSPPPTDELEIEMAYSSVTLERPPNDRTLVYVPYSAPRTRGGGIFPIENGRWMVTIAGIHGNQPPTNIDEFGAFASALPVPEINAYLEDNQLRSETVDYYPFASNLRRRYEALEAFPAGLLVIGDAVVSLNPAYAQGLSVNALQVTQLHHCIRTGGLRGLSQRFFDRISPVIDEAWMVSLNRDIRFGAADEEPPLAMVLFSRYLEAVYKAAHEDEHLSDAIKRVAMMERSPKSLLHPTVVARVVRNGW